MRFVAAFALAVFAVSCFPPVDPPPEKDAGVVIVEVTKPTLTCAPQRFDRTTVPAREAATLQLTVRCVGDAEPRELALVATFIAPDGTNVDVEALTTAQAGEVSVTLEVPAGVISVGVQQVKVWAKGDDVDWFDVEELELRGHQPVSLLTEQWKDAAPVALPALESGSKRVAVLVRDLNADDTLDLLVVARNADKLTVQTFLGPKFDAPASANTYTDARFDVGDAVEEVRFLRRRGATTDKSGALAWWAIKGTEGRAATIDLDSGIAKQSRVFASTALPGITRLLGVDAVTDGVADGAAPELVFFYLGDKAGTPEFVTLTTQSLALKFAVTSELAKLGDVLPDQVLGGAYVGLLRSWKVTPHLRDAVDTANVHAWVALMGTPPSMRLLRVALSGPGAGTAFSEGGYVPEVGEKLLSVSSTDADGDARPDVVVLGQLTDGDGVAHVSFTDQDGALSVAQTTALRVKLGAGASAFSSASLPECADTCLRKEGNTLCGQTNHFLVIGGGSVGGMSVLTAVGNGKTEVLPLSTATRPQRIGPGRGGRGSSVRYDILPDGRITFGRLQPDDAVKLGSSPRGDSVALTMGNGLVWRTNGIETQMGTLDSSLRGLWLFDDTAAVSSSFLIVARATDTGESWSVWWSSPSGVVGPSRWFIPTEYGRFRPSASAGDAMEFINVDDSSFVRLQLPTWDVAEMTDGVPSGFVPAPPDELRIGGKPGLSYGREGARVAKLRTRGGTPPPDDEALLRPALDAGAVQPVETVAVVGVDDTDACPFQTLYFSGDPESVQPVVLSEGAAADCLDLEAPVMTADFLGTGGEQLVTARSTDNVWHYTLWVRGDASLSPVALAEVATTQAPVVSASDVNGDGAVDLLISLEGQPTSVFFSNGRGASFGGASVPGLSDAIREVPGAAPGFGGGQLACGAGLQCQYGSGTRTSSGQASNKAELL